MRAWDKAKVIAAGFVLFAVSLVGNEIYNRGWLPAGEMIGAGAGAGFWGGFVGWLVCLWYEGKAKTPTADGSGQMKTIGWHGLKHARRRWNLFWPVLIGFVALGLYIDASDIYARGWENETIPYLIGTGAGAGIVGGVLGALVCVCWNRSTARRPRGEA